MAAIRPGRPAKKAAKATAPSQAVDAAAPPPAAPPAAKGRSMTVPAIVVAVALLGAAFMLKGGGGGGGDTVKASTTDSTAAEVKDGAGVTLDPITANLASGQIVKVGIALRLNAEEGSSEAEAAIKDPKNFGARALDELITVLGDYTREELSRHGGLTDLKAKLSERVRKAYHDEVAGVLLTQFVIA